MTIKNIIFKIKNMNPSQVLVIGFSIVILLGAFLLMLPISSANGTFTNPIDAIFTATTSVCVTGLVVVDTGTYWSIFGKSVILFLIQIGGLGFMMLTTLLLILMGKKISLRNRILIQSSIGSNTLEGIVKFAKYVLAFTFLTELVGAILLSFTFIPMFGVAKGIWYSVFHSISAFCNAGIDLMGDYVSLTPFVNNVLVNLTISALVIIGGLGFGVVMDIIKKKHFMKFDLHTKIVLIITGILIVFGAVLIYFFEMNNPETIGALPTHGKILASSFTSITPRTAGFNTIDIASLNSASKFVMIMLMFIGGSPGSTAGGIKTTTFALIFIVVWCIIRGKQDTEAFQRRISDYTIKKATTIFVLGLVWVGLSVLLLSIFEPFHISELAFEIISAFGTVGLSLGITPHLSVIGKMIVIITMFMGRVGLITIAFAIAQRKTTHDSGVYKYPDGNISIG